MKTLNQLNEKLATLGGSLYKLTKPMYAEIRAYKSWVADEEEAVAAERASARELWAIKNAVAFLCESGAGDAPFDKALQAGVIPTSENGLPGQIIFGSDEAVIQAVDWLLSFSSSNEVCA